MYYLLSFPRSARRGAPRRSRASSRPWTSSRTRRLLSQQQTNIHDISYVHLCDMYVCIYIYIYMCLECNHMYMYMYMHMYMYVYMYMYMYMYMCMCTCVCVYIYPCVYIYIYETVNVIICFSRERDGRSPRETRVNAIIPASGGKTLLRRRRHVGRLLNKNTTPGTG